MKKFFAAAAFAALPFMLSVNAFAGAPSLFGDGGEIVNTGGEYMPVVYIAIGALALAVLAGIALFIGGKKKR
ncbi:MAG: LPXTG cell wall anchor domain-containing protein [Oscillospiraceae bacterium]